MATPLEYRKKTHKEILNLKDQAEKARSESEANVKNIEKIDKEILSIRKSITDMESKFGNTSVEAVNFKIGAENKILNLETEKNNLNISRDFNKKEFDIKNKEKENKKFERKHQEKIDGTPKYIDFKDKNLKFFNNLNSPIDWTNKTIRHFKEDVPKKVQKISLAALSAVILGTAAYKNKDSLSNYFLKDKKSIENSSGNKKKSENSEKKININDYPKCVKDLLKAYPNVDLNSLKFVKDSGEANLFLPEANLTIYFDNNVQAGYFFEMNKGEGKIFYNQK